MGRDIAMHLEVKRNFNSFPHVGKDLQGRKTLILPHVRKDLMGGL